MPDYSNQTDEQYLAEQRRQALAAMAARTASAANAQNGPDYSNQTDEQYLAEQRRWARAKMAGQNPGAGSMLSALGSDVAALGSRAADAAGVSPAALEQLRQQAQGNDVPTSAPPLNAMPTNPAPVANPMPPDRVPVANTPMQAPVPEQQRLPVDPYQQLMRMSAVNTGGTLKNLNQNQAELLRAQDEKAFAIRREAELQAKSDVDIARINQASLNDQQELMAQNTMKEQNRQQDVKIEMDKYEQLKDEFLNSKVDPDRAWKQGMFGDNMTGNKILASIGIGMASLGGQGNEAAAMINTAIDRDLTMQRQEIERKGKGVEAQKNLVGLYSQEFKDGAQADLAAKMAIQERTIDIVNQRKLNAKSQLDIGNADKLIADMKMDFAKTQSEFLHVSNAVVTQGIMQQGNLQNMSDDNAYKQGLLDSKTNAARGQDSKLYVPGAGYAMDEDSAKKAREAMQTQNSIDANINELQALRAKHAGGFVLNRADVARGAVIKEQVKRKLQNLYQMGVLQQYEEKSIDRLLPDADSYSPTGAVEAAYEQLAKSTRDDTTRKVSEYINPSLSVGEPKYTTIREHVIVPGR